MKHLPAYSVFMRMEEGEPTKLYGVSGIYDLFSNMMPYSLPFVATAHLLPFQGRIIYDGYIETS